MKRGLFFAILVNILLLAFSFTSNAYSNIPDKTKDHYVDLIDEYYKNREFYDSISNATLQPELKNDIAQELDALFTSLKTSVITAGKLYARMKLTKPKSLDALGRFNNQEDLYKITRSYFRKEYYFEAPFISKTKEMSLENDNIIISYAYSLDVVTVDELNNYSNKMHLNRIANYLELFIDMSGDYVQVGRDKLIKKNLFNLGDGKIDSIKKELKYFINSFGSINGEEYKGYSSLPEIGNEWNKYLLLGIVRTYLSHDFKITYSGGTYKTFTFSITLQ